MSCFEILDPKFSRYTLHNAPLKRLAMGLDWTEGPVWFGDASALLFSDIPNNRLLRWSEVGIIRDRQSRLIICRQRTRSVTRTEFKTVSRPLPTATTASA